MKLSELHTIFDRIDAEKKTWPAPTNIDLLSEQHQKEFEMLPRVKYADLPASIQATVRKRFTIEEVRKFLSECSTEFDLAVKEIQQKELDKIIIKTRNNAIYVIERSESIGFNENDEAASLGFSFHPILYGNYAEDALIDVLNQYSIPRAPIQRKKNENSNVDSWARLPAEKMPTSTLTYMFARVMNAGPEGPKASRINRHEKIGIAYNTTENATQYTRIVGNREDSITVYDPQKTLSAHGKAISKMFFFMLQCWAHSGYGREFSFPLSILVDLGMNDSIESARIAVKKFMNRQALIQLHQTIKTAKKTKYNGGVVFYNCEIENNIVTVTMNEKIETDLLANFFTVLPLFAYKLSKDAFQIVHYIMYLARQNGDKLAKTNGIFHVSIEAVRQYLELPTPDEVINYKYNEKIREPIERAIAEIEENMPDDTFHFTITPRFEDDTSVKTWLNGDLEIKMPAETAERFIEIAVKAEKHYKQHQRDLEQANAKAQAIITAKAEQKKKEQRKN